MKVWISIIALLVVSCNSTQLVESWKNPEITTYAPSKVFIVGLTSNLQARQKFETELKNALEIRGIEAVRSLDVSEVSFKTQEMVQSEMDNLETFLQNDGFDTVLLSKIIGIENRIEYKENYDGYDETYKKFGEDFLRYQDIYYNPDYYNEYSIYHAETTMHCICPAKERTLVWKGYIDILDPKTNDKTINNYVNLVIAVLEEYQLITPFGLSEESSQEHVIN